MSKPSPEATRFQSAMRQIMSVPKAEIEKREAEYKKARAEKKSGK